MSDDIKQPMSENLSSLISAAVAAKLTPEFIEKEVTTRVDRLIVESIDRALRSYSPVGKEIERAVVESMHVGRLDLPSYGAIITKILKAQIEARVAEVVAGRLSKDMEELLGLAPKGIKLSKIAEDMLEPYKHDDKCGELITVILEKTDYDSAWLYLDEDYCYRMQDKYRCNHRLLIGKDGTIASATIDHRPSKDVQHVGQSYGLAQKIRAWIACGTKIELDYEDVCTSIGDV
jgi:hypothetical protein